MSDIDDLDDLLADTSADKFKKANYSNIKNDIVPSVDGPPASRKEKKSALLAELFGPSSSTSFNFGNINEDETKISGGFGSMEKNTYSYSAEPIKKVDSFSVGGYTPTAPRTLTTDNNKSRPSSSGSTLGLQPQSASENSNSFFNKPILPHQHQGIAEQSRTNKQQMTSTAVSLETEQPSYAHQSPLQAPTAIPSTNVWNVPSSLTSTSAINYTNQQQSLAPAAVNNNINNNDPTTLNAIKDILENFSANFCGRLQSVIVDKSEGLSEITNRLTELQQCITAAASQHQTPSVDRNFVDENNSKKVAVLENKIEALNQENANLRSRLEHLENQVREGQSEAIRTKAETESLVENSVKWMKEAVNSFDSKLSNYSSSMSKQVEEVAGNRDSVVRQIEKRVCELENKKSSNQQEQQVLHLLKEELKWLQRQKTKLKAERKQSSILQKQIAARVQHMETLSSVMNAPFVCLIVERVLLTFFFLFCDVIQELSHTARDLHAQTLSVDVKMQKIEQKWAKLLKKEEDIQAVYFQY